MVTPNYLDEVRQSLRLKSTSFNSEIESLIEACRLDLATSGIKSEMANDENEPLIKRAIILYCQLHFGFEQDRDNANRLERLYNSLVIHLGLASDYYE